MKKTELFILVVVSVLAFRCEHVDDTTELPYVERIVVSGTIREDGRSSVVVERTLRLDEQYSEAVARIKDADVRIRYSGSYSPSLVQRGDGIYFMPDFYPITVGSECELIVQWNGKEVKAKTRIPYPPTIDTIISSRTLTNGGMLDSYEATITPRPDECYLYSLAIYGGPSGSGFSENRPRTMKDTLADGKLRFYASGVFAQIDSVTVYAYSIDLPFYDWYISRGNTDFTGLPLSSYFSGPFRSNVKGDGVGLFVGRNFSLKTIRTR